jgi:hydrogenase maturation protein HypF
MLLDICLDIRERFGTSTVVLSGGVWQNMVLLAKTVAVLRGSGLDVVHHRKVPSNDGGVSLGQAAIAQSIADEVN